MKLRGQETTAAGLKCLLLSRRLLSFGVAVTAATAQLGCLELGVPRYNTRDRAPLPCPLGHMRSTVATAVYRSSLIVYSERQNGKQDVGDPSAFTHPPTIVQKNAKDRIFVSDTVPYLVV